MFVSISSNQLYPIISAHQDLLDRYGQLRLMDEGDFVGWANRRGVHLTGVVSKTDVEFFWKNGWMRVDRLRQRPDGWRHRTHGPLKEIPDDKNMGTEPPEPPVGFRQSLRLHPFRIFPACRLLLPRFDLSRSALLYRQGGIKSAQFIVDRGQEFAHSEHFLAALDWGSGVADLCIILEPLYWSKIVGLDQNQSHGSSIELANFTAKILELLRGIGEDQLKNAHEAIRTEAAILDENSELYLLLRAAKWERRETLVGALAGALWMRHMAEVLRLGYESAFDGRLPCEDEALGFWHQGARQWIYGNDHPTDDLKEMFRRLLPEWWSNAGIRVRVYVEGPTEKGAMEEALGPILGFGAEVVAVRGSDWGVWLKDELVNDRNAKRFSVLLLDGDVEDSIRSVKAHAKAELIVGMVFVANPDFEYAYFSTDQLCRAAEGRERKLNYTDLAPMDRTWFDEAKSGKDFETIYVARRPAPGLKGEEWGAALAAVALGDRDGEGDERNGFVFAVACTIRASEADYELQANGYRIDPETLESVETDWKPA